MQTTFNNPECAHVWAHSMVPNGSGSNLFFQGPTIYSYGKHFPIAHLSGGTVYFTLKQYSRTTARHKALVRHAISHKQVIMVHRVPESPNDFLSQSWMSDNTDIWIAEIARLSMDVKHKPSTKAARQLHEACYQLCQFLSSLNLEVPEVLDVLIEHPSEARAKKLNTQVLKSHARAAGRNFKQELADWRKMKHNRSLENWSNVNPSDAFLRYHTSKNVIETSKGIKLPVDVAQRFYRTILSEISIPTDVRHSIIGYQVDKISKNGIRVGCHTISMREIKYIARRMKWAK